MVYDCFIFFNELDLLEIRLHELDEVVDLFVLIEAAFTFQNTPKPFYFEENKARYAKFLHKIIHIKLDEVPEAYFTASDKTWILESYQRRSILKGLTQAKDDAIVMISDLDEIPTAEAVLFAKKQKFPVGFGMEHYAYFLNAKMSDNSKWFQNFKYGILANFLFRYKVRYAESAHWIGSVMGYKRDFLDIQVVRENRGNPKYLRSLVTNAGWHFSYLGGVQKIIEKLNSISVEFDYTNYANKERILKLLDQRKDIFNPEKSFLIEKDMEKLPSYVSMHMDKFEKYFYPKQS